MAHYCGYVLSTGEKLKEPWMPDEEDYNEVVGSDYCDVEHEAKGVLADWFVREVNEYLGNGMEATREVLKDDVIKVTIPKGSIRPGAERVVDKIKAMAKEITADKLASRTDEVYRIYSYLEHINPFDTVCVELTEDGDADYDNLDKWLWGNMRLNDEQDVEVYIYGSINHHI